MLIEKMFVGDLILNVYPFGSQVYGCNPDGDEDVVVIVIDQGYNSQIKNEEFNVDVSYYGYDVFQKMLDDHNIVALECFFLPVEKKIKNKYTFNFNLDLSKLRSSISQTASNSFVKCKKKLTVEKDYDPYIAKKSLFHSLRILMLGKQIAEHGKIVDYSEANYLWDEIVLCENNDWQYYEEKYQPLFNQLSTEFRKLAPKQQEGV